MSQHGFKFCNIDLLALTLGKCFQTLKSYKNGENNYQYKPIAFHIVSTLLTMLNCTQRIIFVISFSLELFYYLFSFFSFLSYSFLSSLLVTLVHDINLKVSPFLFPYSHFCWFLMYTSRVNLCTDKHICTNRIIHCTLFCISVM